MILQARSLPAAICRSRKRGEHCSSLAACCFVSIAGLLSSAVKLAEFEIAPADGFTLEAIFGSFLGSLLRSLAVQPLAGQAEHHFGYLSDACSECHSGRWHYHFGT